MRTILVAALVANLLIGFWANTFFLAHADQIRANSQANAITETVGVPAQ
jgi:hypothetical protein